MEDPLRLFVAIDIPDKILKTLGDLIDKLRPTAPIRWSPLENLHVTTKFIGWWPDERIGEVDASLRRLTGREPIPVDIRGLGFFPNARSPRVFWAGVYGAEPLARLARDSDRALAALGVEPEKRAFSPHLTLARVKEPVPLERLHSAIAGLRDSDFGSFTADRFFLYQSRLRPSGSEYIKFAEYIFG